MVVVIIKLREMKIILNIDENELDGNSSLYTLGDITFVAKDGNAKLTTAGKSPNQSTMLFVMFPDFLHQVVKLYNGQSKVATATGVSSSTDFVVRFQKEKIVIRSGKETIEVDSESFIHEIYRAASSLHALLLKSDLKCSQYFDFTSSLQHFKAFYNRIKSHNS